MGFELTTTGGEESWAPFTAQYEWLDFNFTNSPLPLSCEETLQYVCPGPAGLENTMHTPSQQCCMR